ncbi:hypothetical protein [Cystobacter ferrugineus]|uniref:Uncharacterized protein n=1 Tax=Cystobacter ferrugineus TaxID=83449 RepID=A0A1L9BD45_9BACT|nr:hypothetical protein [Cystobacter ferrugineus]OJH40153.1 hypothetical protein BON30_13930 [Cystobacter ferrugineus]
MLTLLLALYLSGAPATPAEQPLTAFMLQPERVQLFLADLDFSFEKPSKKDRRPRVHGFVFTRGGPELKEEERQALAKTWVSPKDVRPTDPKRCTFNPDVALRFSHGNAWVDAVVCFGCGDIIFFDTKGQPLDGGSFRDLELIRKLAVKAFPKENFRGE